MATAEGARMCSTSFSTTLLFRQSERKGRSRFIAKNDIGKVILPSIALEELVLDYNMEPGPSGLLLPVLLQVNPEKTWDIAHPDDTTTEYLKWLSDFVCEQRSLTKKVVACYIDGHNFLCSLSKLHYYNPAEALRRILDFHIVQYSRFYFCKEHVLQTGLVNEVGLANIRRIPNLTMVDRIPKQFLGRAQDKRDIDHLLIADLTDAYRACPSLQGVMLVSGDSDFAYAMELWGKKYRCVVSCREQCSRELHILEGVDLRFLENIISD